MCVCVCARASALILTIQYLRLFFSSICSWKNMCYSCLVLVVSLCILSQNASYLTHRSVYMSMVLSQLTLNFSCLVFISIKALTIYQPEFEVRTQLEQRFSPCRLEYTRESQTFLGASPSWWSHNNCLSEDYRDFQREGDHKLLERLYCQLVISFYLSLQASLTKAKQFEASPLSPPFMKEYPELNKQCLLAVGPWTSHVTSLNFTLLMCRIRRIKILLT